ncbi:hypothetical protein [Ekhidna sp.]|uniref:hypothetical protein n=1 Tax=Ekhidna sp. TaxID=2608089 RepID=UPI0032EDA89E
MIISEAHQKINALRELVPEGFVFIIDTTDRSFVYKSKESSDCEQRVISLDMDHGIDKLTKSVDFYLHEDETSNVKLSRIAQNTFIGVCVPKKRCSEKQWNLAIDYLRN